MDKNKNTPKQAKNELFFATQQATQLKGYTTG
jgi:hypothetical protein